MFFTIPVDAAVYTYDDANHISTVTFSNGKILTYTYNAAGNLVSIVSNGVEQLNVVSNDPANQAVYVPVGKVIEVTFNKEIQAGSSIGNISIKQGQTIIENMYSINGNKLSLTPTQTLARSALYTVSVPVGAIQDSTGDTLDNDLVFSFTTETAVSVTGISLNKTSVNQTVYGTETLIETVYPTNATNKTVTWTSSNEEVATVGSDGTVTGVSIGTATITVTTNDENYTASCEVTVTEAPPVAVNGVSLNKTSTSIDVGNTETLIATVAPENATNNGVTWVSSDEAVASVDSDGTVTGVSAGTATIIVTTLDGSFTAICEVTIL